MDGFFEGHPTSQQSNFVNNCKPLMKLCEVGFCAASLLLSPIAWL